MSATLKDVQEQPGSRIDPIVSARVRVSGRVQRVGYRYWTECWARRLGLAGYVRNLTDGSVDAVFVGAPHLVARMMTLCRDGSEAAEVSEVESARAPAGWTVAAVEAAGGVARVGFRRSATVDPETPPPAIR